MSDNMTVRGFVASDIKSSTTPVGVATASFRLGSTDRRFDRVSSAWVDGNTNWFTVQGYRQLAGNIACSIKKGQRVIIVGKLKMRSWEKEGKIYHVAEIDAESVGHDLMWGAANFTRMAANSVQLATGPAASDDSAAVLSLGRPDAGPISRDGEGAAEQGEPPEIFVDDHSGDRLQIDSLTGELTGAAA